MKANVIILISICPFLVFSQETNLTFRIKKDTLMPGEIYKNDVMLNLAAGDSIQLFLVRVHDSFEIKPDSSIASVQFVPRLENPLSAIYYDASNTTLSWDTIFSQEYKLNIIVKTIQYDTIVNVNWRYYMKPSLASIRFRSDNLYGKVVLNPDISPRLISDYKDLKSMLAATVLKNSTEKLTLTFIVDDKGNLKEPKIHTRRFYYTKGEDYLKKFYDFLLATRWQPARQDNKPVSTVCGLSFGF